MTTEQKKELIATVKNYGDAEVQYGIRLGTYAPEGPDETIDNVREAFEKVIRLVHSL